MAYISDIKSFAAKKTLIAFPSNVASGLANSCVLAAAASLLSVVLIVLFSVIVEDKPQGLWFVQNITGFVVI